VNRAKRDIISSAPSKRGGRSKWNRLTNVLNWSLKSKNYENGSKLILGESRTLKLQHSSFLRRKKCFSLQSRRKRI